MKSKILKIFSFSIIGLFFLTSCKGNQNEKLSQDLPETHTDGIEVIYFFGKQRCSTCVAMEKFAKEAVDSAFKDKIKDGAIVFKSVDITTPDGENIADQFEVTSSSLYIVNNNPAKPEKIDMTAFGFRNARNNRHIYKQGIIDQINKFLE